MNHQHSLTRTTSSVIDLDPYELPRDKLKLRLTDPNKIPLVIVGCGSYSPVTYLHLRMFEMAKDYIEEHQQFELLGAYFSPVSSGYKKGGLAYYKHRVRMCELAAEKSGWIMVDPWEAMQEETQRTAVVLEHFEDWLNGKHAGEQAGVLCSNGERRKIRIMLVAGGDLIQSFASYEVRNGEKIPVWLPSDLDIILGRFGCLIIERTGADVHDFLLSHQSLYDNRKQVYVVKQFIHNDISSTKIRLFIKRGMSIKYLLPDQVIDYIERKGLYLMDEPSGRTDGPFDDEEVEVKNANLLLEEKIEGPATPEVVHMDSETMAVENIEKIQKKG
ncbi:nicotinate-nucleotide adenylyltransferase [Chytriomyces confervae]|uniref:Nicotinamide-nucleotide adenylyltransferase n=1 Tax=Chytriomyces confervae TaxID=246404 RepID=A0A507FH24_9FUNG|nr:hypothetical protein HDU80_010886 [Chytriomyces hyalinus]TPX74925.1 nicotinate-nucleotide adenylyltransferase [Chytriomyces confervae]